MVGLVGAGKSTILRKLNLGGVVTTIPTEGFNVETVEHKNIAYSAWDVGAAQEEIRTHGGHLYTNTTGIIFVVDANVRKSMGEARKELELLLNQEELRDAVLLVFANKQDLPGAMPTAEVAQELELRSLQGRNWYVQATCAASGAGMFEGLDWLTYAMAEK